MKNWIESMLLLSLCTSLAAAKAPTGADLWQAYTKSPDTHPNIPNCSYAGYRAGAAALPQPPITINVRDCGAAGDGKTNDVEAFGKAIAQAGAHFARTRTHGVVLIPEGVYRLTDILHLHQRGVILRGEGPDKTILDFQHSLAEAVVRLNSAGKSVWSWSGGMIWIGPEETFAEDSKGLRQPTRGWESWRTDELIGEVNDNHERGDRVIHLDKRGRAEVKPGDMVLMTWRDDPSLELAKTIAGHERMRQFDWERSRYARRMTWRWPVRVAAVDGNRLTLAQPLRVPIREAWRVHVHTLGRHVSEVGVEHLRIRNPRYRVQRHLQNPGHNGVYINRAYDCWVRNVTMENVEVGFGVAAAKHTTCTGLHIVGQDNHHATACRVASHDNLVEHFIIESRVHHGINTEGCSSGNVWRKGLMKHGTFDSHRAMSFDLIRTDITIRNDDGGPGGAGDAGPFLGARCVHWNIRVTGRRAQWVYQPDCISMGALVGIQGVEPDMRKAWAMAHGDKGCIIADHGRVPQPPDLYEAQLRLRLDKPTQ